MDFRRLKEVLDHLYNTYNFHERAVHDPIAFSRRYNHPRDQEIAGLIASAFAYGRVELFMPVVDELLKRMGASPAQFLHEFRLSRERKRFCDLKYRFSTGEDIVALLYVLSKVLKRFGSLEAAFSTPFNGSDMATALSGFVEFFYGIKIPGSIKISRGFYHFFTSPDRGSACKRMNLFMRWMVRDRDIDLGIWQGFSPAQLVIPLDTHIARISQCLGLTTRKTKDWKMAVEITESLKRLDPEDPLKYDFALCHKGIMGMCSGCDGRADSCEIRTLRL